MLAEWIQFSILMLTFLAFLLRNEHRITVIEQGLVSERQLRTMLEIRVGNLENRNK